MNEEKGIREQMETIRLLEVRLAATAEVTTRNDDTSTDALFPKRSICLYHYLLGDAYRKLSLQPDKKKHISESGAVFRSLLSFRAGIEIGMNNLRAADPLLLMNLYSYCLQLFDKRMIKLQNVKEHRLRGYLLADEIYNSACKHTNTLDDGVERLLQRIRDEIILRKDQFIASHDNEESTLIPCIDDDSLKIKWQWDECLVEWNRRHSTNDGDACGTSIEFGVKINPDTGVPVDANIFANRKQVPEMSQSFLTLNGGAHSTLPANNNETHTARSTLNHSQLSARQLSAKGGEDTELETAQERRYRMLVMNLRRVVSLPLPIMFETLTSSATLLKALERIFRIYVRGSALPGQLTGGTTVEFDGLNLPHRTFILEGPYLSFSGFVQFLLDFHVAEAPPTSSSSGQKFAKRFGAGGKDDAVKSGETKRDQRKSKSARKDADGNGGVVSMLDCALLFLEACKSVIPTLVLKKFVKFYADMAQMSQSGTINTARLSNEGELQSAGKDVDGWSHVLNCLQGKVVDQWDIRGGINFVQFIDCLGKIGAVAYESPRFHQVFPTITDRIEHFLSAFLGLTDPNKWQHKVDTKLKKVKAAIKRAYDRIFNISLIWTLLRAPLRD